jgi:hypothetical protein
MTAAGTLLQSVFAIHIYLLWLTTNAVTGTYSLTASVADGVDSDSKPVTIALY